MKKSEKNVYEYIYIQKLTQHYKLAIYFNKYFLKDTLGWITFSKHLLNTCHVPDIGNGDE